MACLNAAGGSFTLDHKTIRLAAITGANEARSRNATLASSPASAARRKEGRVSHQESARTAEASASASMLSGCSLCVS